MRGPILTGTRDHLPHSPFNPLKYLFFLPFKNKKKRRLYVRWFVRWPLNWHLHPLLLFLLVSLTLFQFCFVAFPGACEHLCSQKMMRRRRRMRRMRTMMGMWIRLRGGHASTTITITTTKFQHFSFHSSEVIFFSSYLHKHWNIYLVTSLWVHFLHLNPFPPPSPPPPPQMSVGRRERWVLVVVVGWGKKRSRPPSPSIFHLLAALPLLKFTFSTWKWENDDVGGRGGSTFYGVLWKVERGC